jgi:hypothetical protein
MNEKKIKKRMIDLDLTQTLLSRAINIPRNRINDAIKGRREGRRYAQQILDFLYPRINSKKQASKMAGRPRNQGVLGRANWFRG